MHAQANCVSAFISSACNTGARQPATHLQALPLPYGLGNKVASTKRISNGM
jgi:hypothetical protein